MITFWYGATSFLFAAVLFFPVRKFLMAININRKSEGMLPLTDLTEEEMQTLSPGDPIDVMVERYDSAHGFGRLAREKGIRVRVWDERQKAHE